MGTEQIAEIYKAIPLSIRVQLFIGPLILMIGVTFCLGALTDLLIWLSHR